MSKIERYLPYFRYRLYFSFRLSKYQFLKAPPLSPYKQSPDLTGSSLYFHFLPTTSLAPTPYIRHASFYFRIITTNTIRFFPLSHHCAISFSGFECSTTLLYLPKPHLTSKIHHLFLFLVEIPLSALNSGSLALISLLITAVISCYASLYKDT